MANANRNMPISHRFHRSLLLAVAALALSGCFASSGSSGPRPNADFRLASLDGGEISPRDFQGEVVLVDFWATWCGPCHKQAEILEQVYEEVDGKGVHFLAVNLGEDLDTVRSFVETDPYPYPVLLDPEDELSYDFGIFGLPTLMVVDTAGNVSYFDTGIVDRHRVMDELRKAGAKVG